VCGDRLSPAVRVCSASSSMQFALFVNYRAVRDRSYQRVSLANLPCSDDLVHRFISLFILLLLLSAVAGNVYSICLLTASQLPVSVTSLHGC